MNSNIVFKPFVPFYFVFFTSFFFFFNLCSLTLVDIEPYELFKNILSYLACYSVVY